MVYIKIIHLTFEATSPLVPAPRLWPRCLLLTHSDSYVPHYSFVYTEVLYTATEIFSNILTLMSCHYSIFKLVLILFCNKYHPDFTQSRMGQQKYFKLNLMVRKICHGKSQQTVPALNRMHK